MANPQDFEQYFCERARLAEDLFRNGWREEAYVVATIALDAIANVWDHDAGRGAHLPQSALPPLAKLSPALRMNAILDTFACSDRYAGKVAVVLFAEDMLKCRPDLAVVARRLLRRRLEDDDAPEPLRFRASPKVYLDVTAEELAKEAPELDERILELAQHYRYPAFAYRFLRSSTVHAGLRGERVNRFAQIDPDAHVDYFPAWKGDSGKTHPISLGIGLQVITGWLRTVASEYVRRCPTPADGFDPSHDAQQQLERKWKA